MSKQVRITLSDEEYAVLSSIAKRWDRNDSDVALDVFRKGLPNAAVEFRKMAQEVDCLLNVVAPDRPHYRSLSQAITCNWDMLGQTRLVLDKLAAIRDGKRKPTELELARIALALKVSEEYLESLPLIDKEESGVSTVN
jgi:hypothetical protein